jgi:hypothetical protein
MKSRGATLHKHQMEQFVFSVRMLMNTKKGKIIGHEGEWRTGVDGNLPGIMMPGMLVIEAQFIRESAADIEGDKSAVDEIGVPVSTPYAEYTDALHMLVWNPDEGDDVGDAEDKYFAPGVGIIFDDGIALVGFM